MRRQKSKRSETSRRSSIIYPITRYEKSKRIEGSKWNKLVPYANGDLENSFTSLKIPHRITFLVLHQRYRCVITFLRFDFYFQGRITSRWTRFFDPSSERLTGSQGPEPATTIKRFAVARTTRDWFPSLFATAKSIRTVALWKSSGYILGENLQIDATNRDAWFVVPAGDN